MCPSHYPEQDLAGKKTSCKLKWDKGHRSTWPVHHAGMNIVIPCCDGRTSSCWDMHIPLLLTIFSAGKMDLTECDLNISRCLNPSNRKGNYLSTEHSQWDYVMVAHSSPFTLLLTSQLSENYVKKLTLPAWQIILGWYFWWPWIVQINELQQRSSLSNVTYM